MRAGGGKAGAFRLLCCWQVSGSLKVFGRVFGARGAPYGWRFQAAAVGLGSLKIVGGKTVLLVAGFGVQAAADGEDGA